jgi:hypothetical protein
MRKLRDGCLQNASASKDSLTAQLRPIETGIDQNVAG